MKPLIGLLGGTFDPVHQGHLTLARELLTTLPFNELRLIPCHQPVHRAQPMASATDRLNMLKLGVDEQKEARLIVDDCELKRHTPSYMIETLTELKQRLPEATLALIMGFDAWQGFLSWHQWERILEQTHLVIVSRPGYDLPTEGKLAQLLEQHRIKHPKELLAKPAGAILVQAQFQLPLSATASREALAKQQFDHLPACVADYIKAHHLYNA